MDDERLLSEALRAHAAGGVSTPRSDRPSREDADDATAVRPRRFRPLGRRKPAAPPTPSSPTSSRTDLPALGTGSVAAPSSGAPPRPQAPGRPGPPTTGAGPWPGPPSGSLVDPYGPRPGTGRPLPSRPAPTGGPGLPTAATIAWWGLVSVLAGGAVGAAVGVLSLLLPA